MQQQEFFLAQKAIALMGQYGVPPVPEHYALFYVYAAGSNPSVSQGIDEIISAGGTFTPQVLKGLRENTVDQERDPEAMAQVSGNIAQTLDEVMEKLTAAGKKTGDYGRTLTAASGGLTASSSPNALRMLVDGLISATENMKNHTQQLEGELQKSSSQIAELKEQLSEVRQETRIDPLTGIANRRTFDVELENAVADWRANCAPTCLLMVDIDHFKRFNDTWGHQTGDQVLRLVAACISENIKGRDTAARYGGEEFAIILRFTRIDDAVGLANQIRNSIECRKLIKKSTGDILGSITVSIGVAEISEGEDGEGLIHRADESLYRAKRAGRNRVVGQHTHS